MQSLTRKASLSACSAPRGDDKDMNTSSNAAASESSPAHKGLSNIPGNTMDTVHLFISSNNEHSLGAEVFNLLGSVHAFLPLKNVL